MATADADGKLITIDVGEYVMVGTVTEEFLKNVHLDDYFY